MSDFSQIYRHNLLRVETSKLAGAAWSVARGGKVIERGKTGYRDFERRLPLESDSLFRLASMTKPVTAAAVMLQVQRGKLSVDDEVGKYIPSFASQNVGRMEGGRAVPDHAARRPVLVRDLLTHSSGLACGDVGAAADNAVEAQAGEVLADYVLRYGGMLLDFDPGSASAYSPVAAFDTLARIVEITSGMTFPRFLETELFGPLGITDLTFFPTSAQWERMVNMYVSDEKGLHEVDMAGLLFGGVPLSATSGGAGLGGGLDGYTRFAAMLACGGELDGVRVLSEETVADMRTVHQPPDVAPDAAEKWGWGMRVIVGPNILPCGSFGWSGAYGTHFFVIPQDKISAVYMSNLGNAGGSGAETAREFERDVVAALGY